jgi:CRP/FNR family transcriptional regulator
MAVQAVDLRRVEMLSSLDDRTLGALAAAAQEVVASPGQVIVAEGSVCPPVFSVVRGSVRLFRTNVDGRDLTLARCAPGSLLFLAAAFGSDTSAHATSQAVEPTRLVKIPQREFRRITSGSPDLTSAVLRELSDGQRRAMGLASDLGLVTVRGRLARFLLESSRCDGPPPSRWTHEEIAASIGSVREVVSRTLMAFVRDGLIDRHRHRIEVLDPEALEALIDS